MDERGGYEDLRGSDRRSVIPYVHGRTEVVLLCLSLSFSSAPVKWRLPEPFIAQCQTFTLRPRARQVAMRWLKHYTASRVLMASSSK
jgi:hypothetical protein